MRRSSSAGVPPQAVQVVLLAQNLPRTFKNPPAPLPQTHLTEPQEPRALPCHSKPRPPFKKQSHLPSKPPAKKTSLPIQKPGPQPLKQTSKKTEQEQRPSPKSTFLDQEMRRTIKPNEGRKGLLYIFAGKAGLGNFRGFPGQKPQTNQENHPPSAPSLGYWF